MWPTKFIYLSNPIFAEHHTPPRLPAAVSHKKHNYELAKGKINLIQVMNSDSLLPREAVLAHAGTDFNFGN